MIQKMAKVSVRVFMWAAFSWWDPVQGLVPMVMNVRVPQTV